MEDEVCGVCVPHLRHPSRLYYFSAPYVRPLLVGHVGEGLLYLVKELVLDAGLCCNDDSVCFRFR
eukprot:12298365-Prorocentrum_lima.AAC.1